MSHAMPRDADDAMPGWMHMDAKLASAAQGDILLNAHKSEVLYILAFLSDEWASKRMLLC